MAGPIPEGDPVVVRADGSGDVPTIQAGLARIEHLLYVEHVRSPLHIMPGDYAEDVWIPTSMNEGRIIGVEGRDRTRIRSIAFERYADMLFGLNFEFDGLTIVEPVEANGKPYMMWRNCRFEGGYWSEVWGQQASIRNSEFLARSELSGYSGGSFDSLVFRNAPVRIANGEFGPITFRDCTFEGPVDTLVTATLINWAWIHMERCHFSGASHGVVLEARLYTSEHGLSVRNSEFRDVGVGVAFDHDSIEPPPGGDRPGPTLWVENTGFTGGRTAIRWLSPNNAWTYIINSDVSGTSGPGLHVTSNQGGVFGTKVRNAGDHAILLESSIRSEYFGISGCDLRQNGGSGIVVNDPSATSLQLVIQRNVIAQNAGAGITVRTLSAPEVTSATYGIIANTAVMNGGPGIDVSPARGALAGIRSNLSVGNRGAGIRVEGISPDSVRANDAWRNAAGDYVGVSAGAGNLSTDPGFCDAAGGDFHLQANSPVAPTRPAGQIGALGIGCEASRIEARLDSRHPVNAASDAPVAMTVFGHPLLDVARIRVADARLAGAAVTGVQARDDNGDGYDDLALQFRARGMRFAPEQGDSLFSAETWDGLRLYARVPLCQLPARTGALAERDESGPLEIRHARRGADGASVIVAARLRAGMEASAELYDVAGRRLGEVRLVPRLGGHSELTIRPRVDPGSGVYFIRIAQGAEVVQGRVALVR